MGNINGVCFKCRRVRPLEEMTEFKELGKEREVFRGVFGDILYVCKDCEEGVLVPCEMCGIPTVESKLENYKEKRVCTACRLKEENTRQ